MLSDASRVSQRDGKLSNELQKKLARQRDLNSKSDEKHTSLSQQQKENKTPDDNTSKRKNETELDKKLTRRRILNGEADKTERLSQFGGASTQSSTPKKKRTTIFNLEQRLANEELFQVDSKLLAFHYECLVDTVKSELTLRGKSFSDIVHFIVNFSDMVRKEISAQCAHVHISGQDDLVPVLLNVFVRAMVGPRRLQLGLFDSILERDSINSLTEADQTIISNIKSIVDTAHNWLVVNRFIDLRSSVTGSVDVKIVMFGTYNTGKSSLIERYVKGAFSGQTEPTIGWDVQSKSAVMHGVDCKAMVWDTAGQERYHAITENFLRGVDGVVVVYDACDQSVIPEQERLRLKKLLSDESVPTVLFGNKSDLLGADEKAALLKKYRKKSHFIGSALTGESVDEAFLFITASALERKMATETIEMGTNGCNGKMTSTIKLGSPKGTSARLQQAQPTDSSCCL